MGFLSRMLVPRGIRRAVHPVRTARRAMTPRSVKKARQALHPVSNAAYGVTRSLNTKRRRTSRAPGVPSRDLWGEPSVSGDGSPVPQDDLVQGPETIQHQLRSSWRGWRWGCCPRMLRALQGLAVDLKLAIEKLDYTLTSGWPSGPVIETVLGRVNRLESGKPMGGSASRSPIPPIIEVPVSALR